MRIKKLAALLAAFTMTFVGSSAAYADPPTENTVGADASEVKWQGPTSGSVQGGDELLFDSPFEGNGFVDASMQGNHTIAYDKDGKLWAWGDSNNDVLGIPAASGTVSVPTLVSTQNLNGPKEFKRTRLVAAGGYFSLALANLVEEEGPVDPIGWGSSLYGYKALPDVVVFQGGDVAIENLDAGATHAIALGDSISSPVGYKAVYTWGNNTLGQIGNGQIGGIINPLNLHRVSVPGGAPLDADLVAAGNGFSLARDESGGIWLWGKNIVFADGNYTEPVRIDDAAYSFTALEAGGSHALAIDEDGNIWGWGRNNHGQVGTGGTNLVSEPTKLTIPDAPAGGFISISAGANHSVAVDVDGNVWTWGDNSSGQLGRPATTESATVPGKLSADLFPQGTTFHNVAASENGTIFISTNGVVWGVGDNASGQLGNGETSGIEYEPVAAKLPQEEADLEARVYFGADDEVGVEAKISPETRKIVAKTPKHISGPTEVYLKVGDGPKELQGTFTFTVDLSLTATPEEAKTGGSITLTAQVAEEDVPYLSGDATVSFGVTAPVTGDDLENVSLDSTGKAQAVITSASAATGDGTALVSQVGSEVSNTATAVVKFVAPIPHCEEGFTTMVINPSSGIVLADGSDSYSATVTVVDDEGTPLPGVTVNFSVSNGGTLSAASETTDPQGNATVTVTAGTAGSYNLSATLPAYNGCAVVGSPASLEFTDAGPVAANSDFTVSTGEKTVSSIDSASSGYQSFTHTIDVTLRNAKNEVITNATSEQLADLIATASPSDKVAISDFTNEGGTYRAHIWSEKAGTKTVSVTLADEDVVVATNGNDEAVFVAGAPIVDPADCNGEENCQLSYVTASTNEAQAGTDASLWVKATVIDRYGNPAAGQGLVLEFEFASPLTPVDGDIVEEGGRRYITQDVTDTGINTAYFASSAAGDYPVTVTLRNGYLKDPTHELRFVTGQAVPTFEVGATPAPVGDADSDGVPITVTNKDTNGIPVALDPQKIEGVPSDSLTFSDFTEVEVGTYTGKVTSTKAGDFPIKLSYNGDTESISLGEGNGTAHFQAGEVDIDNPKTRIYGESGAATANGTETRTVTAELYDRFTNPVTDGTEVVFNSAESGLNPATPTVTTVGGVAQAVFTSTKAQTYDVVGTVGGQAIVNGSPAQITFVAGDVDAAKSDFVVGSDPATANGSDEVPLTVTLRDAFENPVIGANTATLTASADPAAGVFFNGGVFEDQGDGTYTLPITSTNAGAKTISVTFSGDAISHGGNNIATFIAGAVDVANSSFSITNDDATADGVDTQTATVILRDAHSNPVTGQTAQITGGITPAGPTFGTFSEIGTSGTYTADVTSTLAGEFVAQAVYGSAEQVIPTPGATHFVAGAPNFTCEDGEEDCHVTKLAVGSGPVSVDNPDGIDAWVTVVDKFGNPVEGADVTFAVSPAGPVASPLGTVQTGVDGEARITYTSTQAGTFQVSAQVEGTNAAESPQPIVFTAGEGVPTFQVSSGPAVVGSETHTVTVTAKDSSGNALDGVTAESLSALATNGADGQPVISDFTETGEAGVFTATIASTLVGTFTIEVSNAGDPIGAAGPATAQFVAGTASAEHSIFEVDAAPVTVGGNVPVTVRLFDRHGNAALLSDSQELVGSATIGTVGAFEGSIGTYTAQVTSTVAGDSTITVTLDGTTVPAEVDKDTAHFVAGVPSAATSTFEVSDNADVEANGTDTQTVTVTLRDANNNLAVLPSGWALNAESSEVDGFTAQIDTFTGTGSTYDADITALGGGDYTITAFLVPAGEAQQTLNAAGNDIARFAYAPSTPPTDIEVTENGASGKGEPGAEITVTKPGTDENLCEGTVMVGEDGTWSCTFTEPQEPGTDITVNQKEEGKGPSPDVEATIPETSTPPLQTEQPGVNTPSEKTVTGTGIPGAEITVNGPDGPLCVVVVEEDATWSCTFPEKQQPGVDITVTQQENGKTPSEPVTETIPVPGQTDAPVITSVTPGSVSGTGVPGAVIDITGPNGENLGSTEVGTDGTWSVPFEPELAPDTVIKAVQTAPELRPSDPSTGTVPKPGQSQKPGVETVTPETGKGTGVPGAGIEITDPETGEVLCETEVGTDGTWECEIPADKAPEVGTSVDVIQKEGGKTPSEPETVEVAPGPSIPDPSETPTIEDLTADKVTGTGVPGAEITVTGPDGTLCVSTVGEDSTWECVFPEALEPGDQVTVTQQEDGKLPSPEVTGTVPAAPAVPTAGTSTFEVSAEPVAADGQAAHTLTVRVNDQYGAPIALGDAELAAASAAVSRAAGVTISDFTAGGEVGLYTASITSNVPGSYQISVTLNGEAVAASGNDIAEFSAVPLEPSTPPTDVEVTENGASGKGEPGAEITVTKPGTDESLCDGPVIVGGDGTWSCTFTEPQQPGTEVEIGQTEDGKGPSEPIIETVPERPEPGQSEKPTVNKPTENGVDGTGVPGAEITVTTPDGKPVCKEGAVITVGEDGKWSCTFTEPLKPGTEINVVQTENGKTPSGVVTVTVPQGSDGSQSGSSGSGSSGSDSGGSLSKTGSDAAVVGGVAGGLLLAGLLALALRRRVKQ